MSTMILVRRSARSLRYERDGVSAGVPAFGYPGYASAAGAFV